MLAEIFLLRLEATARVAASGSTRTVSTSPFVPVVLPASKPARVDFLDELDGAVPKNDSRRGRRGVHDA